MSCRLSKYSSFLEFVMNDTIVKHLNRTTCMNAWMRNTSRKTVIWCHCQWNQWKKGRRKGRSAMFHPWLQLYMKNNGIYSSMYNSTHEWIQWQWSYCKKNFVLPLVAPFSSLPSAVQQYIHGISLAAAGFRLFLVYCPQPVE